MGNKQSATYNQENPRRVRDLKWGKKMLREMNMDLDNMEKQDVEFVSNMTAPEFQFFLIGVAGAAMGACMTDPHLGDKLAASWKPWVDIVNGTDNPVTVSMWNNWPERVCEEAGVVIEPKQTGKLALPKVVDFNRDYPLNPILNERRIDVLYSNGATDTFNCNYLNYGRSRGDVIIMPDFSFKVCEEIRPAKPEEPNDEEADNEMQNFMAEARDPAAPKPTDEFMTQLEEKIPRWFASPK